MRGSMSLRSMRVFSLSLLLVVTLFACRTVDPLGRYVEASSLPVDPAGAESVTSVASQLAQGRVILVGEEHGVVANQEIELILFEELVRNHGVSIYLSESAYSFAAFVQRYIETGDEELLRQLMASVEGTNAGVIEHREFLVALHELYQELPPENRFQYIGIDVEHMDAVAVSYLRWKLEEAGDALRTDEEAPAARNRQADTERMYRRLDEVLSDDSIERNGLLGVVEAVNNEIARAEDRFSTLLREDALGVRIVLDNIIAKRERNAAETPQQRKQRRDAAIYRTFRRVDGALVADSSSTGRSPQPRYFGQWGAAHIFQRPLRGVDWFGSLLASREGDSEVSSTLLLYMNCRVLERNPYREETLNTWGRLGTSRRLLRNLSPVAIFVPVRGEASPYHSRRYRTGGRPSDFTLAELVDSVILIRNSRANTPYVPEVPPSHAPSS